MKKGHYKGRKEKCLLEPSGNVHVTREGHTEVFITEVRQMLETGSLCVKNLNHVINEVSASVVEAGKLATSIDENARQVNLLALVAAVEAGRAGEKGVGLSAMARKARALAIKSADAVSDTRAHIEYAVTTLESICDISRLTMASHREKQVVA